MENKYTKINKYRIKEKKKKGDNLEAKNKDISRKKKRWTEIIKIIEKTEKTP